MDEPYDPAWALTGEKGNLEERRETFNRLARRAIVALGLKLPTPEEAIDAWLSSVHKFHSGRKRRFGRAHGQIRHVSEAAAEYCAELRTRFHEAGNADSEGKFADLERQFRELSIPDVEFYAIRRRDTSLPRDRYPFDSWSYDHPHGPLSDPKQELDYSVNHVWRGYQARVEHWDLLDRTGPAWAALPPKLRDATAGLSYDLAVLQANYTIDLGLRDDEAMQEFQVETAKLLGQVTDARRASWSRLGLSFDDGAEEIKMLRDAFQRVGKDLQKLLQNLPPAPSPKQRDGGRGRNGGHPRATPKPNPPHRLAHGGGRRFGDDPVTAEIRANLDLPDPPGNPKRRYETSRCEFRGGYIAPELLDAVFLDIAKRAAPIVTQNLGATADDFLELLRTRSAYSAGLRIDSPHAAAAVYCSELRDLDRYPELREFKSSERAGGLRIEIERFEAEFRELEGRDRLGKEEEVARQNEAFARGLPIERGKHGFSVEFPDLVPIRNAALLARSRDLVAALDPKGKSGRPPKSTNANIHEAWIKRGRPDMDSAFLARIAQDFYRAEWALATTENARRRLRERARAAIRRGEEPPAT